MKSKQKSKTASPSVLIQYMTQTRQHFEHDIASTPSEEKRKEKRTASKVMLWEAEMARKYKLTPSSLAMIARLLPERSQGIIDHLPGTGIWAMLEDSSATNVYFSSIPHAVTSYQEYHQGTFIPDDLKKMATRPWQWTLDVYRQKSMPRSYLYDANRQQWTLNNMKLCPSGNCERTGVDPTGFPSWYICDECRPDFDYWTTWLPVMLLAINGDFAETEERQTPKFFREKELRKVRRSGKYEDVSVTHSYEVITFDMSVKTRIPEPLYDHEVSHPTWLEQAIADEAVLYVSKHISQSQRTFKHERYVNMRGKTIEVRAYEKRIPMSVKRLKHTIYKAIASSK